MRTLLLFLAFSLPLNTFCGTIVASVKPICLAVKEAFGASCIYLIKPGVDPHSFEPSLKDVERASKASLCLGVSREFDSWMERICPGRVVFMEDVLGRRKNPHIWLDPSGMESFMLFLSKKLGKNCSSFCNKLSQIILSLREDVKGLPSREFISFHPVWSYLAEEIGLKEVLSLLLVPTGDVSFIKIRKAMELKKRGVKVLVGEVTEERRVVESLGKRLGLKVVFLDPMGWSYSSYTDFIEGEGRKLLEALR